MVLLEQLIEKISDTKQIEGVVVLYHPEFWSKMKQFFRFKGRRQWRELRQQGKTKLSRKEWMKETYKHVE